MDLRIYYRKIQEVESTLVDPYVVVVSFPTPDGGKGGILTETSRQVAAKQIAEGRARLADAEEAAEFHSENIRRKREREEQEHMNRVQFVMVPPRKHQARPAKDE